MKTKLFFQIFISLILVFLFNNFLCSKENDPELDCSVNRESVSSSGQLLVNGSGQWFMNVADLNGSVYVADKNCHAEMYLTFEFKDEFLAETNKKPPILIIFTGGGGFFDPGSITYSSTLDPVSETYFWNAYCSQAAKNASENPTNFGISVTWDPDQISEIKDVLLSGEITYRVYEPE